MNADVGLARPSRKIPLHIKILISLALGIAVGLVINLAWSAQTWSSLGVGDVKAFLAGREAEANTGAGIAAAAVRFIVNANTFIGAIFIRALRFVAVPIVLFSLIAGVHSLGDLRKLGRIGGKTVAIFAATTVVAIMIGIGLALLVQPGTFIEDETRARLLAERTVDTAAAAARPGPWETLLAIVPANPFAALAAGEMLQVVTLAVIIGAGLTMIPAAKSATAAKVCDGLAEALAAVVSLIMRIAPVAVFALVVPVVAAMGTDVLGALAAYAAVVVVGLAVQLFGTYPLLVSLFARGASRIGYARFFKAMAPAQLLAVSSSSSNATLPVTMQCTRERLGVSEEITSFVCPLGATINMDGTALYQAVIAIFLAQVYGIPLGFVDYLAITVTATLVAVGSAGVPGASVVLIVVVLGSVGIPAEGVAIILGLDRVLDMCRTVVNITGDAAAAAAVAATEGQLKPPGGLDVRGAA